MGQKDIKYYFLGIGGIGMSSLAKYLFDRGHQVMGYDKKQSIITDKLIAYGIPIIFDDNNEPLTTRIYAKGDFVGSEQLLRGENSILVIASTNVEGYLMDTDNFLKLSISSPEFLNFCSNISKSFDFRPKFVVKLKISILQKISTSKTVRNVLFYKLNTSCSPTFNTFL